MSTSCTRRWRRTAASPTTSLCKYFRAYARWSRYNPIAGYILGLTNVPSTDAPISYLEPYRVAELAKNAKLEHSGTRRAKAIAIADPGRIASDGHVIFQLMEVIDALMAALLWVEAQGDATRLKGRAAKVYEIGTSKRWRWHSEVLKADMDLGVRDMLVVAEKVT